MSRGKVLGWACVASVMVLVMVFVRFVWDLETWGVSNESWGFLRGVAGVNFATDIGSEPYRSGVIVLGMHRSGTSLLTSLIYNMGLRVGEPTELLGGAPDNPKGFFERTDMMLQNEEFFAGQSGGFEHNTYKYDHRVALKEIVFPNLYNESSPQFRFGRSFLAFVNQQTAIPYVVKEPRLCITLRTWLPLLSSQPAIVFTYRHPMDVAKSISTAHDFISMELGLKLWYIYNRLAVQHSSDMCRVATSHSRILKNPFEELDNIHTSLRLCGVRVPHRLDNQTINSVIDSELQHEKVSVSDNVCELQRAGNLLNVPVRQWNTTDSGHTKLYREVMRVFCALEDGSALAHGFKWDHSIQDPL